MDNTNETEEKKASSAFLESTLLKPDSAAIALISSALFIIRKWLINICYTKDILKILTNIK